MPSGRTHDSITLWGLPVVTGTTWLCTENPTVAIVVAGSYLFAGLMFGPDLDIYSHQYKRWGWLRWLWLPYRKMLRHRSVFSHGFLVGTIGRILYVVMIGGTATGFWILGWSLALHYQGVTTWDRAAFPLMTGLIVPLWKNLQTHWILWLAVWFGLETGSMSHSISDTIGSAWKRSQRKRRSNRDR
ncbi:MAG: metal-binding protein [Cyanobacteria bacterium]|nr:metal-binding protein [Cyanobacteriota bacterium]